LLACALPERSAAELWGLGIGRRDALLLDLRRCLFGRALELVGACPACGELLECSLDIEMLRGEQGAYAAEPCELDGYCVLLRAPTSLDLHSALGQESHERARAVLLERCVAEVRDAHGGALTLASLSDAQLSELVKRLRELDGQADVRVQLACAACQHTWRAPFDIATYLWSEVDSWARRTLRDVHCLARAYGWSEAESLALSATRRRFYLELCRA
jgi:hypothetical protein